MANNVLSGVTDDQLFKMMRRLKDTLEAEMRAASALSDKIHRLNLSVLLYTIAIALMAAFQFGAWLRDLMR